MTDITIGDNPKFTLRLIAWYAQRQIAKSAKAYGLNIPQGKTAIQAIHDDLFNSPNPVIRKMHGKLLEAASHMISMHQKAIIVDLGSFALWVCYKDTAYNQPAYWILNEIIDDPDFKKELSYYVETPDNWYCRRWQQTKMNTGKLRREGKLSKYALAKDEEIFVPEIQQQKWEEIIKHNMNDEIKKNSKLK